MYCIERYEAMINGQNIQQEEEVTEIKSMREIAGWGDKV